MMLINKVFQLELNTFIGSANTTLMLKVKIMNYQVIFVKAYISIKTDSISIH